MWLLAHINIMIEKYATQNAEAQTGACLASYMYTIMTSLKSHFCTLECRNNWVDLFLSVKGLANSFQCETNAVNNHFKNKIGPVVPCINMLPASLTGIPFVFAPIKYRNVVQ